MAVDKVESVLVVPTAVFQRVGYFQGFSNDAQRYVRELLCPKVLSFRRRDIVEDDFEYKQLIPYVVFRWLSEAGEELLFEYVRGGRHGDARLRTMRSIGIGGHISEEDVDGPIGTDTFERGMRREIDEEVQIQSTYSETCAGIINDDSNSVGQVHLGFVYIFNLDKAAVRAVDPDISDGRFTAVSELLRRVNEFETWSQIYLRSLMP
jgi:predicted NUDIX family phosphoesterase